MKNALTNEGIREATKQPYSSNSRVCVSAFRVIVRMDLGVAALTICLAWLGDRKREAHVPERAH
ncbi:hypothetical protein PQR08_29225, partial [Caballeronia jiangsuensis]